jgi:hypothetical protein
LKDLVKKQEDSKMMVVVMAKQQGAASTEKPQQGNMDPHLLALASSGSSKEHGRSYSDALVFLGIPNFFLYKNKYIYRYTICIIHIDVYLIVLELKVSQVANFAWPTMARTGKARPSGHGPSAVVPPPASFPYLLPCATRSSSSFCDYDSRLEQSNSFPIPNSPSRP